MSVRARSHQMVQISPPYFEAVRTTIPWTAKTLVQVFPSGGQCFQIDERSRGRGARCEVSARCTSHSGFGPADSGFGLPVCSALPAS